MLLSPSAESQELPGAVVSSRGHVASGSVLFDQASTEASAVSALKTNVVASLKRQREIPAEPAPRGEGNGRRALLPAFDRADEHAQGVGDGRPREQWSEVDVEEEDDSNLAQGRETQSAFMRAVNYQDDLAICIRCENIGYDVSKHWQIKRGGRQPGAVYQQNEMVSRLAKHVNVLASQFPPLSHGSRLLPKTKQYPNGAFILRFNTKKHIEKVQQLLQRANVMFEGSKPYMIKVQSAGWSVQLTSEQITKHLEQSVKSHMIKAPTRC